MNILISLFKIFYAGTMTVYPSMNMYGSGIIQSVQAGYRLGTHFGLFNSGVRPITPGPITEHGAYAWWLDAATILKNTAPLVEKLIQSTAK